MSIRLHTNVARTGREGTGNTFFPSKRQVAVVAGWIVEDRVVFSSFAVLCPLAYPGGPGWNRRLPQI